MLPEIGASELLVIGIVALIVVGPKDLPVLLRKLGKMVARVRGMANEFRASFDEMARQSELDELRKEVEAMRAGHYAQPFQQLTDSHGAAFNETFNDIHAGLNDQGVAAPAVADPAPIQPAAAASEKPPAKPRRKTPAKSAAASAEPSQPAKRAAKPRAAKPKAAS